MNPMILLGGAALAGVAVWAMGQQDAEADLLIPEGEDPWTWSATGTPDEDEPFFDYGYEDEYGYSSEEEKYSGVPPVEYSQAQWDALFSYFPDIDMNISVEDLAVRMAEAVQMQAEGVAAEADIAVAVDKKTGQVIVTEKKLDKVVVTTEDGTKVPAEKQGDGTIVAANTMESADGTKKIAKGQVLAAPDLRAGEILIFA